MRERLGRNEDVERTAETEGGTRYIDIERESERVREKQKGERERVCLLQSIHLCIASRESSSQGSSLDSIGWSIIAGFALALN